MTSFNISDFQSADPNIKYASTKLAIELSTSDPASIYPYFNAFITLLDSENNILKWTAILVLGNLSTVATEGEITNLIPKLFETFHSESMITSSNSIKALFQIAQNKPQFTDQIIQEILKIEEMNYINKGQISPECRNVAIGHILDGLSMLDKEVCMQKGVYNFIKRQSSNTRAAVVKRANKLMAKIAD